MLPVSGLVLVGVGLGRKSSRKRRFLMGLLMGATFTLLLFLPACHTAAVVSTTTGTPAGTYTVTVDAVSGSATRSQVVTLVVQ
jgi:ABC-type dipeptide/oligopeptide/nickel transport system permease subunit